MVEPEDNPDLRASDPVDEAAAALAGTPVPEGPPPQRLESTVAAMEQEARMGRLRWMERVLGLWRGSARGGQGEREGKGRPRRPWGRFAVLAAVLVAVNAGGLVWIHHDLVARAKQKVRVLSAMPAPGAADDADRFTLVFDEPWAQPEAVGRTTDAGPYIITPQPPGHWRWAAPDRLEFLLAERLPPGRVYTVRPASDMEARLGRRVVGPSEFRYQTRALQVQACQIETADEESVNFCLYFNQPVHPDDVLKSLSVIDGNSRAPLKPASLVKESSDKIVLRVARPASDKLSVRLAGDLKGPGAALGLGQDGHWDLAVPGRFTLLRAVCETPGLEKGIQVSLSFSQNVDRARSAPEVRVAPAVEDLRVSHGYGHVMHLNGAFVCGRRYTATVPATLLAANGQTLGEERSVSFDIPNRQPSLRFVNRGGILSPAGNLCLDLEAVNVQSLYLSASRVHTNNLLLHLRKPGYSFQETARPLPTKEVGLDLPMNTPGKAALELKGLMDQPTGIYHVRAAKPGPGWAGDNAVVAVTDLGITAKRHKDGYLVWVTSLATGKPVGGVTVSGITYTNQTVAKADTDNEGVALLKAEFNHPDGPAWVIVAEKGDDASFLKLDGRSWDAEDSDEYGPLNDLRATLSRLAVRGGANGGRARPKTYEVMLYGERGVYRPGETVHMTGLVRDANGAAPLPFPIVVNVRRPDGRVVAHLPAVLECPGQGLFHVDYATLPDGQTGAYKFTATLPGSQQALGSAEALVEAFVPVRLEVKARPTKERFFENDTIEAEVTARYLFDQPGAGLPVAIHGVYREVPFTLEAYKDYVFGGPLNAGPVEEGAVPDTVLDDSGHAKLDLGKAVSNMRGLWRAEMTATVTEPGGRSVSAAFSFLADWAPVHVGLRLPASRIVPVDSPVAVDWVAVDGNGRPSEREGLRHELVRLEWDWAVEQVNGRPVWKSKERLIPVSKGDVAKNASSGRIEVRCPEAGRYRLSLAPGESFRAVAEFYAARAGDAPAATLVERPEKVEIVLDKAQYAPGDTAKVLVRSPFRGTMLLTVETDRVIDRRVVEMADKTAEIELPVPADLRGGTFVSATVVRAVDPQAAKWLPVRASGLAHLTTDHSSRRLELSIDAPSKVRPGQKVRVTVRTAPAAKADNPPVVHLWAVDEGVLLCTAYRTPAPMDYFLCQRGQEVGTADLFDSLMPDYKRPADIRKIGGDGDEEPDESLRRSAVPIRTTQAAVLWHKAMPVAPDGTAEVELDVPQFTGEVRLMAVAADGDSYGSAQRAMTVSSPLMVEASWPRFASPGDKFQAPVKVFNNTDRSLTVRLSMELHGPLAAHLAVDGAGTGAAAGAGSDAPAEARELAKIELEPGKSKTLWLDAEAGAMGQVAADILAMPVHTDPAAALGDVPEARSHAEFTIRTAAPLHSVVRLLTAKAGDPIRLDPVEELLPGTARATVEVSGRPSVQLRPAVEELLDYPYGCVEQTTSRLYGILYAPDLLLMDSPRDARAEEAGRMIRAGIVRLWSMQTRNGGLAYWPGDTHDCLWPSAYVGVFLTQARQAGYTVEKEFTDALADYLYRQLNDPSQPIGENIRAQICRVLAALGRPHHGWMNRLAERLDLLDVAGRADLAAAYAQAGRKDLALKVLPEDTLGLSVSTTTGGRITSATAQHAALLSVLLDIEPAHPWVGLLAGRLDRARAATGRWGTTLENAQCIAALAKYQTTLKEKSLFTGTLKLADGTTRAFDSNGPARFKALDASKPIEIATTGSGPVYICAATEGLARDGATKPYDRQFEVRRQWRDLKGNPVDPKAIRVGDLIVAEVYFRLAPGSAARAIDNLAIVDALAGGVEVENTRLATSAQPTGTAVALTGRPGGPWELPEAFRSAELASPDRVEWLDDRVVIFTTATGKPQVYRYLLRATCGGTFRLPAVQGSCMYDPSVASLHGGGEVIVRK